MFDKTEMKAKPNFACLPKSGGVCLDYVIKFEDRNKNISISISVFACSRPEKKI